MVCEYTNPNNWSSTYSTNETISATRVYTGSCLVGTTPSTLSFKARRVGTSGSTVTAGIWDITGSDTPIATLGTPTLDDWTTDTAGETKTYANTTTLTSNHAIGLKFTGGDASNKLQVNVGTNDLPTAVFGAIYQSGWTSTPANAAAFFTTGAPAATGTRLPPPPLIARF